MDMLIVRQVLLIGRDRFLLVLPARLHVYLGEILRFNNTRSMPVYLKRKPPLSRKSVASEGTE